MQAKKDNRIFSEEADVVIQGGPMVKINPGDQAARGVVHEGRGQGGRRLHRRSASVTRGLDAVFTALTQHLPRLYAVVDPARDPEVLGWLNEVRLPFQCLFQGEKAKTSRRGGALPRALRAGPWRPPHPRRGSSRQRRRHLPGQRRPLLCGENATFGAFSWCARRMTRRCSSASTTRESPASFCRPATRSRSAGCSATWWERWLTEGVDQAHLVAHYVTGEEGDAVRSVRFDQVA